MRAGAHGHQLETTQARCDIQTAEQKTNKQTKTSIHVSWITVMNIYERASCRDFLFPDLMIYLLNSKVGEKKKIPVEMSGQTIQYSIPHTIARRKFFPP